MPTEEIEVQIALARMMHIVTVEITCPDDETADRRLDSLVSQHLDTGKITIRTKPDGQ